LVLAVAALALVGEPGCGPSTETFLASGERACRPVVAALEAYRQRYGRYPETLDLLVRDGLLEKLPDFSTVRDADGPHYRACQPLGFYRLWLGCYFPEGIGPGDRFYRVLVSDNAGGWTTCSAPLASMEDLIAERLRAAHEKSHDPKLLALFMGEVIGKAPCDELGRDRIVRWLGEGVGVDVPPEVIGPGRKGRCYGPAGTGPRFCVEGAEKGSFAVSLVLCAVYVEHARMSSAHLKKETDSPNFPKVDCNFECPSILIIDGSLHHEQPELGCPYPMTSKCVGRKKDVAWKSMPVLPVLVIRRRMVNGVTRRLDRPGQRRTR
jgi:hypothetical protein